MTIDGRVMNRDLYVKEATAVLGSDIVSNARLNGNVTLTYLGPETITVDGKTYDCTRYAMGISNTTGTEWYTRQAPMPVKSLWMQGKNYVQVTELVSWS
jgi:hypothetical protein